MESHEAHMRQALALAERGLGRVSPNPLVGAVVVADDGTVVGEGWHEGPGSDHAEVMALRAAGARARGATLVVTLEPCNHYGRTPPCTKALIEAGIRAAIVGATDPALPGDAPGVAELRAAGIDVEVGLLEREARRMNAAFEAHVRTGRPFVLWKAAASLDGRSAAVDGTSRWISSPEARADAHRLRAWADAIVVGAGTVVADDPRLTVRDVDMPDARPPLRVVVDSSGRVPASAKVFDDEAPTLIATTDRAGEETIRSWRSAGADVVVLEPTADTGVALPALLDHLGKLDVQGVLLEGGPTLAWGFLDDDLVDRVVLYVAPLLLGGEGAPGVLAGTGSAPVDEGRRFEFHDVRRVGPDIRMEADVHGPG